jgi:transcription antitermination factor NusA-like protein
MSYLKVSILIPDNVIGFILGIEGKNIKLIRNETGSRIEVHPQNNSRKYRQIEIAGEPLSISKAAEKIYGITYLIFIINKF